VSYVTLAQAKQHLEMIHDASDETIQDCIDDAEDFAANYMGRPGISDDQDWSTEASSESSSSEYQRVPPTVRRAILMLTAEYFEHRTQGVIGANYTKLPAVEQMLHFHRVGLGV
jgi:hypothetical protein